VKFKLGDKVVHRLSGAPMIIIGVPSERICKRPCEHCNHDRYKDSPIEYRVRTTSPKGLGSASMLECELEASRA